MKRLCCLLAVLVLGCASPQAKSEFGPATGSNLGAVVQVSNVIAIGRITDTTTQGNDQLARMVVQRFIKNEGVITGSVLTIRTDKSSRQALGVGTFGLMLFKTNRDGTLRFSDVYTTVLPAAPSGSVSANDPMLAVAQEMVGVIGTPGNEFSTSSQIPPNSLAAITERTYSIAASGLKSIGSDKGNAALRQITSGAYPRISKVWAALCLFRTGDVDSVGFLVDAAQNPGSDIGEVTLHEIDIALETFDVANAATDRLIDKVHVLTSASDAGIRRGVAALLRNSLAESALRPLASLISDPDFEVRYFAMSGLAEITELQPVLDAQAFAGTEQQSIAFWTAWKQQNGY
jgi:hypothetical protein